MTALPEHYTRRTERSPLCPSTVLFGSRGSSSDTLDLGPNATRRFWAKVKVSSDGCWEWTGVRNWKGYGAFGFTWPPHTPQKRGAAHRIAYQILVGPIPDGLQLDHLCRNRACVRPSHLEPVTNRENWSRGNTPSAVAARQTHCRRGGHPLSGGNLYVTPQGFRSCKTCRTEDKHNFRARRRTAS